MSQTITVRDIGPLTSLVNNPAQTMKSPEPAAPTASLPDDMMRHAFTFLSPQDLARASGLCREWRALASSKELWDAFDLSKRCKVIDQGVWEKHVNMAALELDASGAPPIDKRQVIPFLKKVSKQVEGNAGVTLLTMPKGLTLQKLIRLAAAPKKGAATFFKAEEVDMLRIAKDIGVIDVHKTYTVAITNSVLKDTRYEDVDVHSAAVQQHGGELPNFLAVSTLIFLTSISSPEGQPPTRLYSRTPLADTRCKEKHSNGYGVCVGTIDHVLYVNDDYYARAGCALAKEF